MFKEKVEKILSEIHELEKNPTAENTLPQNTYYLNEREIVCYPRRYGESRFPYNYDGLNVWAHSTGYINACESTFTLFRISHYGEDPCIAFFGGLEDDGKYFPVSVTGAARQLIEPVFVKRYVVYSMSCVYYIADTDKVTFAARLFTDDDKHIHFSVIGINKTQERVSFYLASFYEALLRFSEAEGFWHRMSKFGFRYDNGSYILRSGDNDCLTINCKYDGHVTDESHTASRGVFLGYHGRTIPEAESLRVGKFDKYISAVTTTDLPCASDIIHFTEDAGGVARLEYDLKVSHDAKVADELRTKPVDVCKVEADVIAREERENAALDNMKIEFTDWNGKVNASVLNKFLRNVQKQVSFCALGKNYAGPHIGIRDVFQQLEGSLIWQPEISREKILTAMNYILSNGRPPRQFSIPADENSLPEFDFRPYIDQGVWIISTIYTYLSYTEDYSLLNEVCSYYDYDEETGWYARSKTYDSVLVHMVKIMDYLISIIDTEEGTNCLRVLFGDWNDAVDGLGYKKEPGHETEYGSGVTVMATLQFYMNLKEMSEILAHIGGYDDRIAQFAEIRDKMEAGLMKYAIDTDDKGNRRIIHGWGDKMSYKIGSFHDPDGKARLSITANAFWAISGIIEKDPSLKAAVVDCMKSLRSKYGMKTFDVPFPKDMGHYVGRIAGITPGTYENSCAYVHASMFGAMALFLLGESEMAWRELETSMVISHDNCTMTSFVMPNSYCENPDYQIDGESMGDWYTGSGTMLIKEIIKTGFGIMPDLDGLTIAMPKTMPTSKASIKLNVKKCPVTLKYVKYGAENRTITVNGKTISGEYDSLMDTVKVHIPTSDMTVPLEIIVAD